MSNRFAVEQDIGINTVLNVIGVLLALLASVAGGSLIWVAWTYSSVESAMAATVILAVAGLAAAPVRVYRNRGIRVMCEMCAALLILVGLGGILLGICLWSREAIFGPVPFVAMTAALLGSLFVGALGATLALKSAKGRSG